MEGAWGRTRLMEPRVFGLELFDSEHECCSQELECFYLLLIELLEIESELLAISPFWKGSLPKPHSIFFGRPRKSEWGDQGFQLIRLLEEGVMPLL